MHVLFIKVFIRIDKLYIGKNFGDEVVIKKHILFAHNAFIKRLHTTFQT